MRTHKLDRLGPDVNTRSNRRRPRLIGDAGMIDKDLPLLLGIELEAFSPPRSLDDSISSDV